MPRAKSSLTPQQVTNLKDQLTEILDNSRSKYEIQVTPQDNSKFATTGKKSSKDPKLFVKPLSKHEIEMQQKALSYQIGQEIKTRHKQPPNPQQTSQQPRVCYSYEANQSKEKINESNDFLLVLTSPSQNEEVQATMENWASNKSEATEAENQHPRPRSVTEIAKSFEEGLEDQLILPKPLSPTQIQTSLSVEQVKKSFEQIPQDDFKNANNDHVETEINVEEVKQSFEHDQQPKSSPPLRTESFCKAIQSSLGKLSKSTSSLENVLDEDINSRTGLGHFNDLSMSNPDISDNEVQTYTHRPRSRMFKESRSELASPVRIGSPGDQTKYSRAYLTLVKAGDVTSKLTKFDPNHFPKGYSYKIIQQSKKMSKDTVDKKVTKTQSINIKAKEHGHVTETLRRLEAKNNPASSTNPVTNPASSNDQQTWIDPASVPPRALSWTDQKAKLKHFCKKMSHSRILSKMMALQQGPAHILDKGTEKLMNRTNQEELLKSVYQAGQVESKVDFFEKPAQRPLQSPGPEWASKLESSFSWSKR